MNHTAPFPNKLQPYWKYSKHTLLSLFNAREAVKSSGLPSAKNKGVKLKYLKELKAINVLIAAEEMARKTRQEAEYEAYNFYDVTPRHCLSELNTNPEPEELPKNFTAKLSTAVVLMLITLVGLTFVQEIKTLITQISI